MKIVAAEKVINSDAHKSTCFDSFGADSILKWVIDFNLLRENSKSQAINLGREKKSKEWCIKQISENGPIARRGRSC
jgi:hypothetical protein